MPEMVPVEFSEVLSWHSMILCEFSFNKFGHFSEYESLTMSGSKVGKTPSSAVLSRFPKAPWPSGRFPVDGDELFRFGRDLRGAWVMGYP